MAFPAAIMTNKGIALQAKAQAGTQLNYTRIAIGDGSLGGQSIPNLVGLISEKKSLSITKLETRPGGKAVVGMIFSNSDIVTGFYFREIGVFAQDPDEGEILYCYANAGAGAEYIAPYDGTSPVEKHVDLITSVGNASNVTATIDDTLVYVTQKDLGDLDAITPKKSTADLTYYVRTDGSDTNDGLTNTAGGAFKTIGQAISMIPPVLNHIATINVAAGNYAERVIISGFIGGGSISIVGSSAVDTTRAVTGFSLSRNVCPVTVSGFNLLDTASAAVFVSTTIKSVFTLMNIVAATAQDGFRIRDGSTAVISSSTISNRSRAIYADASRVTSNSISGSGNTVGLVVDNSGLICTQGTQAGATTAQSVIIGVINPWDNNTSPASLAASGYQKLASGVIVQWGTINIASGSTVTLPISFPSVIATILITPALNNLITISSGAPSLSTFNIYHSNGTTASWVDWMALGY